MDENLISDEMMEEKEDWGFIDEFCGRLKKTMDGKMWVNVIDMPRYATAMNDISKIKKLILAENPEVEFEVCFDSLFGTSLNFFARDYVFDLRDFSVLLPLFCHADVMEVTSVSDKVELSLSYEGVTRIFEKK